MRESQSSKSPAIFQKCLPHLGWIFLILRMAIKTISHKYSAGKHVVNSSLTEAPCWGGFKLCQVDFITNHHHTHVPCYLMNDWRWEVTKKRACLIQFQVAYSLHTNHIFWICTVGRKPEPSPPLTLSCLEEDRNMYTLSQTLSAASWQVCTSVETVFILAVNQK